MKLKYFNIFIILLIGLSGCLSEDALIKNEKRNFSISAKYTIKVTNISTSETTIYRNVDYNYITNNSLNMIRIQTDYNKIIDIPRDLNIIEIEEHSF